MSKPSREAGDFTTIGGNSSAPHQYPSGVGMPQRLSLTARLVDDYDDAIAFYVGARRQVAIGPQEPVLFHRALAEKIRYGHPGASLAENERAARLASAHNCVVALPKGHRTLVGERGVKLSVGERQRVAIARGFLVDAPVLILDEATSSLVSGSKAAI